MSRSWKIFCGAVLLLLPFVLYAPAVGGGKVWDDFFLVGQNPFFRSPILLFEAFQHWLFLHGSAAYYRPIQNWSYFIDYFLWPGWMPGFHLSSILVHACAGLLWWRLARVLLRDEGLEGVRWDIVTFAAALLWTIHPAHNAAVAYVSGRADPLAAFFALSAWLVYRTSASGHRQTITALAAATLALAALCSRETGLLWLGIFVCHEIFVRRGVTKRRRAGVIISGTVLICVYGFLRSLPERVETPEGTTPDLAQGLWKSVLALGDYATLLVAPLKLSMERTLVAPGEAGWMLIPPALALLCFIGWLCVRSGPTRRLRRFLSVWFFGASLPILPLLVRNADSAEHWMYIPFLALILAGCCLVGEMKLPAFHQNEEDVEPDVVGTPWLFYAAGFAMAWASLLAGRTVVRAMDWKDHRTFLEATLKHGSATDRIQGVLAAEWVQQEQLDSAEEVLRKAIAKNPDNLLLRIPLGKLLERRGNLQGALEYLNLSIEQLRELRNRHPLYVESPIHQASVLWKLGRKQESLDVLQAAVELWPDHWGVHAALGSKLESSGRSMDAVALVRTYLEKCPWDLRAWESMATLQMATGELRDAMVSWERAVRLDIHRVEGLLGLARVEIALGNRQGALDALERAICRDPNHPTLLQMLREMEATAGKQAR